MGTKMSKETKQKRAIKKFISEKTIPHTVAMPENMVIDYHRAFLEYMGFKILKSESGFFYCVFPKGWKKVNSDMLEWCYVLDNYGRKRAAIFYKFMGFLRGEKKGQLYSKVSAHINWIPRYQIKVNHVVPFDIKKKDNSEHNNSPIYGCVFDNSIDESIYELKPIELITDGSDRKKREQEIRELTDKLYNDCINWIKEEYPEYDNVAAYWENKK
jgi:hypothetical protein